MKQYYRILEKIAPYAAILVSGIIAYRKVIFSTGPAIQVNDIPILFYPTYFFVKHAFTSGQIPFWDTHLVFGQPLLFNLGMGLLYFPFLIFLYFSGTADLIPRHLELFIITHLILSGITMYLGMRKIGIRRAGACLGGIIFQLYIGNRDIFVWPPMSFGLPWVPLAIFYFFSFMSAKEKTSQWNGLKDKGILIFSYFILISTAHPHLLSYTYFQTFLIGLFFIIHHLFQKNSGEVLNCIKKTLFYPIAPIFLSAFIILPTLHYLPQTTRWMLIEDYRNIGPLYTSCFATMFLPILTWRFSAPYAYVGILTILLVCGYCLLVNRDNRGKYDFYWILLAIFWILFSIQESPLYKIIIKHAPFMQSMRFTYRGMIFYALSISPLAGKFFDILYSRWRHLKFQWSFFLILPIFLILMLIYTGKPFLELVKNYPIEFDYRLTILLISIGLFGLALFIHYKINNIVSKSLIMFLIPIWLVIEILLITSKSPSINYSDAEPYSPYNAILQDYKQEYPEVYNNGANLYRIENYNEPMIVPYYFNTYSVHGYLSQATHPRRYYYLWHEHGGWFGYKYYRFWDLAYLPFNSPIYDLMGVKYFIAAGGTEADPLDREIRGKGEWVEGTILNKKHIGIKFRFTTQEQEIWSFSPSKVSCDYSSTKNGILFLSLYFDGDSKEDEYIKMRREGINVDLEKYPWLDLNYKVDDPKVQTIEIVLGIDFNRDGVVDSHRKSIYPNPTSTDFDTFHYNILENVKEDFPDKEYYNLIELELYPHKFWGVDCTSAEKKRNYKFYIKNLKIYNYISDSPEPANYKINNNSVELDYISKIRLYNTQDDSHRRMTKGHLDLDGKPAVSFDVPMEPGGYEFSFEPTSANKFKLTIDEVKFQKWDGTDGVMIGEMELYNSRGEKIKIDPLSLKTSSTFWTNHEKNLIDGDPESPWQSGCRIALKEMMETDTVKEIKRGFFINTNVLPRVFMVRNIKVLNNIAELAKELHASDFNPSSVLLLENNPKEQIEIEPEEPNDIIEITNYSLNKIEITADIKTPGYLVLTDTHLPGWYAYVNGKPKEILRAYGYFRAIALNKGFNKIVFSYFPPLLISGIIISLITFLSLIILVIKIITGNKYAAR